MSPTDGANSAGPGHGSGRFADRVITAIARVLQLILSLSFFALPVAYLKLVFWLERHTDYYARWAYSRLFLLGVGLVLWLGVALVLSFDDSYLEFSNCKVRRRSQLAVIVSALIAASPTLWLFIWSQLGVPPSRSFVYYCVYLTLLIVTIRFNAKRRVGFLFQESSLRAVGSLAGILLASTAFAIFPVIWAHGAMRLADRTFLTPIAIEPSECKVGNAVIAHISDLHVTENYRTRDGKVRGNERLPLLLKGIDRSGAAYLIVSGDLTDSGSPDDWRITDSILTNGLPRSRVIAAPGNHDLNEFFGLDPDELELREKDAEVTSDIKKMPRLARFIAYQSFLFPSVQTYNGISTSKLVSEIPKRSTLTREEEDKCWQECKKLWGPGVRESQLCFASCRQNWQFARFDYLYSFARTFPLLYVDYSRGIAFFSIASTLHHSDTVGDNAIGEISEEQINRIRKLLRELPAPVNKWVFTMHHPLVRQKSDLAFPFHLSNLRHPIAWKDALYESDWFLAIFLRNDPSESRKLLDVISEELDRRPDASALIFFGHRHQRSLSHIGRMTFIEAPNVATSNPNDFGFYTVSMVGNSSNVAWCNVR